jgi:hypothetical protein
VDSIQLSLAFGIPSAIGLMMPYERVWAVVAASGLKLTNYDLHKLRQRIDLDSSKPVDVCDFVAQFMDVLKVPYHHSLSYVLYSLTYYTLSHIHYTLSHIHYTLSQIHYTLSDIHYTLSLMYYTL